MLSDALDLDVSAAGNVAVNLYLAAPPAKFHWAALQTMYIGGGDRTSTLSPRADGSLMLNTFVGVILVETGPQPDTIALGDSITDAMVRARIVRQPIVHTSLSTIP